MVLGFSDLVAHFPNAIGVCSLDPSRVIITCVRLSSSGSIESKIPVCVLVNLNKDPEKERAEFMRKINSKQPPVVICPCLSVVTHPLPASTYPPSTTCRHMSLSIRHHSSPSYPQYLPLLIPLPASTNSLTFIPFLPLPIYHQPPVLICPFLPICRNLLPTPAYPLSVIPILPCTIQLQPPPSFPLIFPCLSAITCSVAVSPTNPKSFVSLLFPLSLLPPPLTSSVLSSCTIWPIAHRHNAQIPCLFLCLLLKLKRRRSQT